MSLAPSAPVVDIRATLSVYRFGHGDPTTRLTANDFWRATLTPHGPGTIHIWWRSAGLDAEAWGDGATWLLDQVAELTGGGDAGHEFGDESHPAIRRAQRNHRGVRIGASRTLYHELLPVILGQRVTAGEAIRQWAQVCRRLGAVAPGPDPTLCLPPAPQALLGRPAWWFHPFGIESKRAEALRMVARHAARIGDWASLGPDLAAAKLRLLRGIGPWTIGSALGPAIGDADAVAVGDYHIPNMVSWALAGEARGSDARMLQLLEPHTGQRGRVIRLLAMDGNAAPAFGPRQRIQPMHRH